MAGFGIPSAWGRPTPGAPKPPKPTSTIWGQPASRSNGLGGFTLSTPKPGTGGLAAPQTQTKQSSPQQPGLSPSVPAAPAPSPTPATQSGAGSSSPLDSTYFNNLAANQFKVNNQLNQLSATSQNDNTALKSALDQLAYQQPRDSLKLEQGANRAGGLYSSVYDQNLGNLQNSYLTRQSAATQSNAQKQAAIQSQIAGIQGGVPIYNNEQYDAAVGRAIKNAANNPATGQAPAVSSTPTAPAPAPAASVGQQLTPQQIAYINAGLKNRPVVSAGNVFGKGGFGVPTRPVVSAGNRTGKGKR